MTKLEDLSPEHQAQARRQLKKGRKVEMPTNPNVKHKFGARRAEASPEVFPELAGRSFPSQLERDRAYELVLLQRGGQISKLTFQTQLWLTDARVGYKPDFVYIEDGRRVFEETKGFRTERWLIIKKLWRYYGPGVLRIMKRGSNGRIIMTQQIPGI